MKCITTTFVFPGKDPVAASSIIDTHNFLIVFATGEVVLWNYYSGDYKTTYHIDTFALRETELAIYTFENYAAIVQRKNTAGVVLNLNDTNDILLLSRGDYYVDLNDYPVAFFKNISGTFLIHGTDWNRLDITNLHTKELLTSRNLEWKDGQPAENYLDYFHGKLQVSPHHRYFTSNGWGWGPYDQILLWETETFLHKFERGYRSIEYPGATDGYNWGRPLCWVDNDTLAYGYSISEDDNDLPPAQELVWVDASSGTIKKRIPFEGFRIGPHKEILPGELFFDSKRKLFIALPGEGKFVVSDENGNVLLRNSESYRYAEQSGFFWKLEEQQLSLVEIEE